MTTAYIAGILECCWRRRRLVVQCWRWTWSADWPQRWSVHCRTL